MGWMTPLVMSSTLAGGFIGRAASMRMYGVKDGVDAIMALPIKNGDPHCGVYSALVRF